MSVPLPEIIAAYFAAANARCVEEACLCFAPDAIVHDEGSERVGIAAIRQWIEETLKKYDPHFEASKAEQDLEKILVTVQVRGSFPGSPIEFAFEFRLREGKILELSIS